MQRWPLPRAYPSTSTLALTAATLPYVLKLAHQGLDALRADPGFSKGVCTFKAISGKDITVLE
jgi:alanine dehydrogenase